MHRPLCALTTALAAVLAALAPATDARGQKGAPAEVMKELAPAGKLRAGINLGNAVLAQKSKSGELGGVSVDLSRELARRLGVPVELIEFQAAGRSVEAMERKELDLAFFAIEPKRANQITFSPPYVIIDGTYMVRKDSPLKNVADVDKPGIRIAVGLNSAYDLYLTRTIKQATIVRAKEGGGANIPLFLNEKLDAAAGTRPSLVAYAKTDPNMRVMQGNFQEIRQAMGTPKGRDAAARYVRDFVEEMKKSGFVAAALKRSGQDATVAPSATN